jgi:hypothetical protein
LAAAFRPTSRVAVVGSEGNDALKHGGGGVEALLKQRRGAAVEGAHREGRLAAVSLRNPVMRQ